MPIFKKLIFNKTTILKNDFLQNKEISLAAKGLLGYMLSLPNNWDFTISGIAKQTGTSKYEITNLLKELEINGYHTKKHIYQNGRIKDWAYYIFAEPRQDIINKTFKVETFEQELKNQDVVFQDVENNVLNKSISNKLDIEKETKEKNKINENIDNIETEDFLNKSEKTIKAIKKEELLKENIKCIIDYLNETTGKKYTYNRKDTVSLIKARFKDGFVLDDFYDVIDKKWQEWKGTTYEDYVKPSTLFKESHFEDYLNQKNTFKGTPKISYSSKPTFDNTANHDIGKSTLNDIEFNKLSDIEKEKYLEKLPVADMTQLQKEYFNENCLVTDWQNYNT